MPSIWLPQHFWFQLLVHWSLWIALFPLAISHSAVESSEAALAQWSKWHAHALLTEPASFSQREWDAPVVREIADSLLACAPDNRSRARFLAGRCKETGAWLNAFPITPCGLRMDDESVRVAIELRLGAPIGHPHQCCHCGTGVDELATHGLSSSGVRVVSPATRLLMISSAGH